ncbi:hypothetical protein DFP72DRAFT_930198 [Ephemerocybe angulata]|uniref:Secreted protein n=1 Tax=Ephemerocybe angulata TaxID=980116 RepID=A0A8H6HE18_9AGAR|nr:hypothetical protein DFP72DRAFT_930198 [Tulosesus angulatus]
MCLHSAPFFLLLLHFTLTKRARDMRLCRAYVVIYVDVSNGSRVGLKVSASMPAKVAFSEMNHHRGSVPHALCPSLFTQPC